MKIADNVYYVGVSNPTLRVFDIIMCTEYGTTYNSYLVKGADKTALIDGAHKGLKQTSRKMSKRSLILQTLITWLSTTRSLTTLARSVW